MSTPILATKLYIPPPRPTAIRRPHLVARLHAGLHRKLTLIAAPAGCGKTTLVSEWLAAPSTSLSTSLSTSPSISLPRQVAWLSLDEADSDPTRFLAYVIAALRTIMPTIGVGVLDALQQGQPPLEALWAALLNEIAIIPEPIVLVLDDYHQVDTHAGSDVLPYIIEHLPPQMHLVIATREDPRLPLARLRARDQLTELRGADLRFTPAEAAAFLHAMNLHLAADEVAALEKRTEGWIAGLQLAALSMQGQHDVAGFIQAFAGDHRYIVDYLVEEVLQRQPEAVRRFLLQTAILDEMSGPLCDAVTGQIDGKTRLEALERGNFFVIPLDDKRQWYRYHHLFADVLQVYASAELPDELPGLHQRASAWYEQNGAIEQAIHHALAAKDFARVAHLAEQAFPAMRRDRQGPTLLGWLKALPDAVIRGRPVLCVAYAWALMASGELEAMEPWLQAAESWLQPARSAGPTEMLFVDAEEVHRMPTLIAIYRAGRANILGNVHDTVKYAQHVLDIVPDDDHLARGAATALQGLAYWVNGDLDRAYQTYTAGMALVRLAGNISDVISSTIARADLRLAQGQLRAAMNIYEQALDAATKPGAPILLGTADLYVGLGELYCERNDLQAATQHLRESKALSERTGLPQDLYRWHVAMARMRVAQGDLAGALDLLHVAERLYRRGFFPNVQPVAALIARVWVSQGRVDEALGWVRTQNLSAHDDLTYLHEFEHITLARVLIAGQAHAGDAPMLQDAVTLLARLLRAAQAGGRMGSVVEILLLQALAHHAQGDIAAALMPLEQALTLAAPEGYSRIFVDVGMAMAQLLRAAAVRKIAPAYIATLLRAFDGEQPTRAGNVAHPASAMPQPLVEPLSERELEVLRLFATELSGPEIAEHLVIALSTVRTHTKGIYSKLNVNSRREAVRRAAELNLL